MNLLYNAKSIPAALMSAALNEQDLLCRVFGRCRHGATIDREVGDLIDNGDGAIGRIAWRTHVYLHALQRRAQQEGSH